MRVSLERQDRDNEAKITSISRLKFSSSGTCNINTKMLDHEAELNVRETDKEVRTIGHMGYG